MVGRGEDGGVWKLSDDDVDVRDDDDVGEDDGVGEDDDVEEDGKV